MKPAMLLWLLFYVPYTIATTELNELQVVILDVGEGQAALFRRGHRGILIDSGHAGVARSLLDKLEHFGVEQLDHVIFTHLHPDHASGYFRLREAFPNAIIHDNGDPAASSSPIDMVRWTADALTADDHRKILHAGESIKWMNMDITSLWPDSMEGSDLNGNSLVLSIRYFSTRILVMGDAGEVAERYLLNHNSLPSNIKLLVVGHHGSAHTNQDSFLRAINPETCVISVNRENIRGYPDLSTVQRLENHCDRVLRTDLEGDIELIWRSEVTTNGIERTSFD